MRVVWTRSALVQLEEIQEFLALESPRLAHRVTRDIYERTNRLLSANPRMGRRGRDTSTRELVLSGSPYIVVYWILEEIEILAVLHAARDWPGAFRLQ